MAGVDPIFDSWLRAQLSEWERLAPETDLVDLAPLPCGDPNRPPRDFLAHFSCAGLIRDADGAISEAADFAVAIHFGEDHLRRVAPLQLAWMLHPQNVWHPNIAMYRPVMCLGHLSPGISLADVLFQIHGILSWQNFHAGDFLNPAAAAWARENMDRFPVDPRPLKRRPLDLKVEVIEH